MPEFVRISLSLEQDLVQRFDRSCRGSHFITRSEAIRGLIREKLSLSQWIAKTPEIAGSLTLVYAPQKTRLADRMLEIRRAQGDLVVATMHVPLTEELCMEVISLRGKAADLRQVAAQLAGLKGVHQSSLVIARGTHEDVAPGKGGDSNQEQ